MIGGLISQLIGQGPVQFGTFSSGAGQMVLDVPKDKGIVIFHMRLHAFADLGAGERFTDPAAVLTKAWHQLRVIGTKGINTFHARHKLVNISDGTDVYTLPNGYTDIDCWLNHNTNVIFELSHVPAVRTIATGTLPGNIKQPLNAQPPGGYGRTGMNNPTASIATVSRVFEAGVYEIRMFGGAQAPTPAEASSTDIYQWPINASTALNAPQPGIAMGQLTYPLLEVKYILVNKQSDSTFLPPTQ